MHKMFYEIFIDSAKILLKASFNTAINLLNLRKEITLKESYKILDIKNITQLEQSFLNLSSKNTSPYIKNIVKNAYLKIKKENK